jgi:mono/diheme cytochrome c family protein
MSRFFVLATGLVAIQAWPGAASAQSAAQAELAARGREIAERWCANCHVVSRAGVGPAADAAPPFVAVARMPSTTEMSLRVYLRTPHDRMPDYQLTQDELDGLVAYILSLREAPR